MDIQKPTVLDAARLGRELSRFKGMTISEARYIETPPELRLTLTKGNTLRHVVERRFAYIGLAEQMPEAATGTVRALEGFRITGASQPGNDRIVALELDREDRLGRIRKARLILEIRPNHGDAILTDENGAIKWTLRKKEQGQYVPPAPLKKATVLDFSRDNLVARSENPGDIKNHLFGLSPRDLINLMLDNYGSAGEALDAIREYVERAKASGPAWIVFAGDNVVGYSLVSPHLGPGEREERFESALEMYERYFTLAQNQGAERSRFEALIKILDREIERERGKIGALKKEMTNAENAKLYKRCGELILANIDSIPRGARNVRLENFEVAEYLDIELDPSKTASANAEAYFKKYRKASSSLNLVISRIEGAEKRLSELEEVKANSTDDIEGLESELMSLKLVARPSAPRARVQVQKRLPYKKFWSSSGWEILVGRTNKDNDELTFKVAAKDDYWFHAWQAAGSHTVLRPPTRQSIPDKQTLLEAAALAAYFSKARTSSKVPVAYTQVKFVHKPKKFPPGKVLVEKEKQLMVRPANPEDFQRQEEE